MKPVALAAALGFVAWFAYPGAPATARQKAEQELARIHELELQAHRQTNVALLMQNAQQDFVSVRDGKIARTTAEEGRARFEKYFKNAKYQTYEDMEPTIVRASEDGTMGWVISRTHARRTQLDPATGREEREEFVYAGIMIYELKGGKWVRVSNVSTFEPEPK